MTDLIAVILGGGTGSRLFPLTLHRSKPAVPLAGKYRLVDIPISNCINSEVNRIFVLTQFNSASLNRHIARTYQFDRFRRGFVSVLAAEQTADSTAWYQGTADAVRRNLPHFEVFRYDQVLVAAGDQLYLMDYRQMLAHHRAGGADVTIATSPVTAAQAAAFGILRTDAEGRIVAFKEKPAAEDLPALESRVDPALAAAGRRYHASMGLYLFERRVLHELLESCPDEHDFGRDVIPRAITTHRVVAYPFGGYWSDIGTIRSYFDAHLMLAGKGSAFNLYDPAHTIFSNARMLPPAKIENSFIQDSMIGEASIVVNSHISSSVVGIRSFIGSNTTIKNSILVGSNYFPWQPRDETDYAEGPPHPGVGEESYLEGVIVDRNVSIGRRCVIHNRDRVEEGEGPGFFIRDGLVVILKNAVIDDFTII